MSIDDRLRELKVDLPEIPPVVGNYLGSVRVGNLLFISGHGPWREKWTCTGKVDTEVTVEQAYDAARDCALGVLATLKRELETLDKVKRIVRVTGYVNSDRSFGDQPKVINGASDLFQQVFGENGRHARTALGISSLYRDISVEIEAVVQVI